MSEALLQELRDSRESAPVAYANFTSSYSESNNNNYCFFEGDEDKRYYGTRIKLTYKQEYEDFTCGGRDNVKRVANLIKLHYKNVNTMFFIDKDFSSESSIENIYVTPCYSIENFYTIQKALKEVLINEFNMKQSESDFNLAMSIFNSLQNEFHKDMLFFNAWLACQSDLREKHKIKTRLSIDDAVNKYFKSIIKNDLSGISDFSHLQDIDFIENNLFSDASKIDTQDLETKVSFFQSLNKHSCFFRGKFELKFFVSFLKALTNELNKRNSDIFEKKRKCTLQFQLENILSTLTQYANTPECLYNFFDSNLKTA